MAVTAAVLGSVGIVGWSFWQGASWAQFAAMTVDWRWVGVALLCVVLRDAGYVVRLSVLARGELNARRATSSILLWELASALTPSVVGGSAVASFILHRNGLTWGRSLATVMATALLDELYFLLAVPVVAFAVGWGAFLPGATSWLEGSVATIFAGGYLFMAVLATLLSTALFWSPQWVHSGLIRAFSWRRLRRWRDAGLGFARDLRDASRDLQTLSFPARMLAASATFVSWTARFMTLNALIMAMLAPAFSSPMGMGHFDIWARQLSMWTVMMISPTPGSSGLAEFALPTFLMDVVPFATTAALWTALVLAWRYLTYHLYVLVGGVLMPFWLAQTREKNDPS